MNVFRLKIKSNFLCFTIFLFCFFQINAQILEPVKWESKIDKVNDSVYKIRLEAKIDKGWYIYSQYQQNEDSFAPTTYFEFYNQEGNYSLKGHTSEPSEPPIFDPIFQEEVVKFKKKAVFEQSVTIINLDLKQIDVHVDYQTCDDSKCIPGDYTFNIALDGYAIEKETIELDEKSKVLSEELKLGIRGWDKFERTTIKEKSNLTLIFSNEKVWEILTSLTLVGFVNSSQLELKDLSLHVALVVY